MTPYSAAAGGSFSSRASSRCAAFSRVLGQLERLEPLAQLLDLGLLGVALAELLLDRLQLLAQEELALALLHLRLDLRLDLRAELQHLELAVQDRGDLAQPLLDVRQLEQVLLLLGLDAHRRGDEVAERARVVDVRGGELQLLGQVRDERDHAARRGSGRCASAPRPRATRSSSSGSGENSATRYGSSPTRSVEVDALDALDEDAQRPVGDADQLVDDRRRADLVEVVEAGRLGSSFFTATSASSRSPATTSSISLIDRSWPIASGVIDSGKTTVSFSGSTGRIGGSSGVSVTRLEDVVAHARVTAMTTRSPRRGRCASGRTIVSIRCS